MKVCIDGLPFFLNKHDLGEYSRELVINIAKENSISLTLLKDRDIQKGPNFNIPNNVHIANIILDRINNNYTPIINYLKNNNIDVYHCLNNGFSLTNCMEDIFVVTTFHSLIPLEYEDYYKDKYKNKFFNSLPLVLNNTNAFIVPSQTMKNKLINLCNIPVNKIYVAYPLISKIFQNNNKYMSLIYLRSKFNITDEFILFSGDFHKRKRIEDLIEIFFRLHVVKGNLKLIFLTNINEVNIDYYNEINMLIKSMSLTTEIKFITKFTQIEKNYFFNSALCFIDFSLYDDMNLSLAQAFICKCPIICSDIDLHRELLGDCGAFINLDNINAIEIIENYILNIKNINIYNPHSYEIEHCKFNAIDNINKIVNIYNYK